MARRWLGLLLNLLNLDRLTKATLQRVRPQLWQSPAPEYDYGFPSGHAMANIAFVVTVVILSWRRPWRGWIVGVGAIYVLTIAWTRLYLGVHYPSDILAGWLASVAWTIGTSLLIRPAPAAQEQIEAGDLNRP
jgi:membrane-associated phospholipid phosphatase